MKKEKTTQPEHGDDVLLIRIKNIMESVQDIIFSDISPIEKLVRISYSCAKVNTLFERLRERDGNE